MLTYFPRFLTVRAIICYLITLTLVSSFFMNYAMPFQFMVFGVVYVVVFFNYVNKLTMNRRWARNRPDWFKKNLFVTALIIRIVYVVFIYFYYIEMTGMPHMYHPGDELVYVDSGSVWRLKGYERFQEQLTFFAFSDRGYITWLNVIGLLFGTHIITPRIVKCFLDAFACVLIYNTAKRNFGESVGRMASIFYMLIPNSWFYCGITLKETEMAFMVILFVERADFALHSKKITFSNLLIPGIIVLAMFTFRTALAAVLVASLVAAIIFSSGKQLEMWKKILYTLAFAVWMFFTVGVEMVQETQRLWDNRTENQSVGYQEKASRGGNSFVKYATASTMAPLIFTIPISSMVEIEHQETQMMQNGAFFIKNILSGFTIFALLTMLFSGEWRKHVLPISLTSGYLVVLVFSVFAHSERFHFPVLALELMFAAYGISLMKNKHKRWATLWMVFICIGVIAWNWIKLHGRGFV